MVFLPHTSSAIQVRCIVLFNYSIDNECTDSVQLGENNQQQQLSATIKDISALSVFLKYFPKVCEVVSSTTKLGNDLVAAKLISDTVLDSVDSNESLDRYRKVSKYMTEIRHSLKANDKSANLESFCHVLYQQKLKALDEIADTMLTDIGNYRLLLLPWY